MAAHGGHPGRNSGCHRKADRDEILNHKGVAMKEYYFAAFVPEEAGNFTVYFPDIPDCVTGGCTLGECVEYGEDIFREMVLELAENKKPVPAPSGLEKAQKMVKAIRAGANLPYPKDTVYQLFSSPVLDDVPVRVTISLSRSLLEEVDRNARAGGFTRSGFLAHAAQACMMR